MIDRVVLNPVFGASSDVVRDPVAHSAELLTAARTLTDHVSDDVRMLAASLRAMDPAVLSHEGGTRVAFWTNVYNALMLHAVVACKLSAGRRVSLLVFSWASYQVGSYVVTLHAIEHGVLRCNRPVPYTFWCPMSQRDARLVLMPRAFDPRVHFALNCAAASCPPIRVYTANALDAELDVATHAYVTQETRVDRQRFVVHLPYLCQLYDRDFGSAREALCWVARYLDAADRTWIEANLTRVSVRFNPYRWELVR
jgi:hypothetical protein